MKAQLAHATLFAADLDKAAAFHGDALGLKLEFTPSWSEFGAAPTTLALRPASETDPPSSGTPT